MCPGLCVPTIRPSSTMVRPAKLSWHGVVVVVERDRRRWNRVWGGRMEWRKAGMGRPMSRPAWGMVET